MGSSLVNLSNSGLAMELERWVGTGGSAAEVAGRCPARTTGGAGGGQKSGRGREGAVGEGRR